MLRVMRCIEREDEGEANAELAPRRVRRARVGRCMLRGKEVKKRAKVRERKREASCPLRPR